MSADEYKEKGNDALKKGDMSTAINMYTEGIKLDSTNYVLYSNRCTAHLQQKNYASALEDAQKTIELNSAWAKGYLRCGQALYGLGKLEEAVETLNKGLSHNPDTATLNQLNKTLGDVQNAKQQQQQQQQQSNPFANLFDENMWTVLASNPEVAPLLNDQDFVQKLKMAQSNPSLLNSLMQTDQRFMQVMLALLQAKGFDARMASEDEAKNTGASGDNRPLDQELLEKQRREREEVERRNREQQERLRKQREAEETEAQKKKQAEEEQKKKQEGDPAFQEKTTGNAFFAKKQFDQALPHYLKAIELNPDEMVYRLNAAACLMEMGQLEKGIEYAQEALEVGRKQHAEFQMIAKALARIGNAYFRMENYKKAIEYYEESLTEHRNREIVQRKLQAEQLLRKQEELAYINPDLAEEHRQKGNQLFQEKKFPEAMKEYNEGIKRNPNDPKLYLNRATTYIKLATFPYALKDADRCLELDPSYVRAYARKGQCHFAMKEYHKAIEAYDNGLKLDPNSEELKQGKAKVLTAIATSGGQRDEERLRRAQEDPEIQAILSDPAMRQVLTDLGSDPEAARHHLTNPLIAERVNKLIAAGVLQVQ